MRRRTLTYADAVRLIGEPDDPVVAGLGDVAGVGAGAITVGSGGTVDFFALRDQLVRWGHTAVAAIRDKLTGLDRVTRTDRLAAAHAVVVITAFFEALDDVGLDLEAAAMTAAEQVAVLTDGELTDSYRRMVAALVDAPVPLPTPARPRERVVEDLTTYYGVAATMTDGFLRGLAAFEDRDLDVVRADDALVRRAVERYAERYRALAADAPEFGIWSAGVDAQATRESVRAAHTELTSFLGELREAVVTPAAVDAVPSGLATRNRGQLDRLILAADGAPEHVTLPRLGESYVDPSGHAAETDKSSRPATEEWWTTSQPVLNVPDFLLGHLTTPAAVRVPTVVLGHPGSGKSALTRILAARLTESGFLAIRVELRSVPGDASVQSQIEQAITQALGESVSWTDIARRIRPALPVVLLDGFDELLQATGLNRADYLEQVQAFQDREAEIGRPVAVIVTSRTVVADRARFPVGSVVIRLDPFEDAQVQRWLETWNAANQVTLASRSLRPLPVEVALRHGDLARQPLLLLLLALYDAGSNALQSAGDDLRQFELYERLFADFIAREVDKGAARGLPADERDDEIEREWRRLGAVALAILNRGGDVILEAELDRDLPQLLEADDLTAGREWTRSSLSASQLLMGRFFFVHEARASRDTGAPERSFEFLHATFGDFLAARLIVAALRELALERRDRRRSFRGTLDAGFLYAATSFVTVTRRPPLWEFCQGMLARLPAAEQRSCRELVLELLPEAGYPKTGWSVGDYEPRRKPFAARHAAFSANLVCFAVVLAEAPVRVEELSGGPVPEAWRNLALLWESQLDPEDRGRIWQAFRVAWRLDDDPIWLGIRVEDSADVSVYESLPWPSDGAPAGSREDWTIPDVVVPADAEFGHFLRRSAFVQTTRNARSFVHDAMAAWSLTTLLSVEYLDTPTRLTPAGVLQQLLLTAPSAQREGRGYLYAHGLARGAGRFRTAVLRQLAEEPRALLDDDLSGHTIIDVETVAAELPYLARIVAATDADQATSDAAAELMLAWDERLDDAGAAWPVGAHEVFRRAFAGVGLPLPNWIGTFELS